MFPPFCPNPRCDMHFPKEEDSPSTWFRSADSHHTKVVGEVPRFRCTHCGRSFSERTFDIDYYAKKVVPYREVFLRNNSGEGASAIARNFGLRVDTVLKRISRLARTASPCTRDSKGGAAPRGGGSNRPLLRPWNRCR